MSEKKDDQHKLRELRMKVTQEKVNRVERDSISSRVQIGDKEGSFNHSSGQFE